MKVIPKRGVTAPVGFQAAGIAAGIKTGGKKDLALICSQSPASTAAAFTRNLVAAAPVVVSKANVGDKAQAIVINSGNANACTGPKGILDARTMIKLTAEHIGSDAGEILVASTGIIGRFLPMDRIARGIIDLQPKTGPEADNDFAQAIMTTDAWPKQLAVELSLSNGTVWIGGVAKGAGMIAPDLAPHATMIAVITTDAKINSKDLGQYLATALDQSFNIITVDGDTSTNDSVFVLANGMAGDWHWSAKDSHLFQEALNYVCLQLAKMIVRDGEGATKLIEYKIVGAHTEADARKTAKTLANSILVKTAFFGGDPNWGRLLAAAGRAGADINPDDIDIDINGIPMVRSGKPAVQDISTAAQEMKSEEIQVWVNLNQGSYQGIAYGCDLSYDYVKLNAEYNT